jgi:hypothetical protein
LEKAVKRRNLTFGILLIYSIVIQADIVKTETFVRGDKFVYLLHDTHVSTDHAELQARAIDQALKATKNVKFLVQQVEPIFEADYRLCDCLDDLSKVIFNVCEDEIIRKEIEGKEKFVLSGGDICATNHEPNLKMKKTDPYYGVAPFLDSFDCKKFYINQLQDWFGGFFRFFTNEEYFIAMVKEVHLKKMANESWQTLITNTSVESFFYQYEVWDDCFSNLSNQIKSEKNREWLNGLSSKLTRKKKELKKRLKNDKKYIEKLNEIKAYEGDFKLKFVYPKISDQFITTDKKPTTNHNDMLMVGIDAGVEAVALSFMLDDKSAEKKIVLLASSFICEKIKEQLVLEGFAANGSEGVELKSLEKVPFSKMILPFRFAAGEFEYRCKVNQHYKRWYVTRIEFPLELCTPFKD